MPRITPEKIALAEQFFRDGYSIPECCKLAGMSRASFNKHCKKAVDIWLAEHNEAKANRAKAEIMPEPVSFSEPIASEPDLTYEQFVTYAEFELDSTTDFTELKAVYDQLKADYNQKYQFVIKLRELYEARLTSKIVNAKLAESEADASNQSQSNKDIIRSYRNSLQIKLPIARDANEWDKSRLLEHLAYWRKYSEAGVSYKQALAFITVKCTTDADRQHYVDSGTTK